VGTENITVHINQSIYLHKTEDHKDLYHKKTIINNNNKRKDKKIKKLKKNKICN